MAALVYAHASSERLPRTNAFAHHDTIVLGLATEVIELQPRYVMPGGGPIEVTLAGDIEGATITLAGAPCEPTMRMRRDPSVAVVVGVLPRGGRRTDAWGRAVWSEKSVIKSARCAD